jgi:hypothetical protein
MRLDFLKFGFFLSIKFVRVDHFHQLDMTLMTFLLELKRYLDWLAHGVAAGF